MPTYEYQCTSCGHKFEAFQKITDEPVTRCPECEKDSVQRLISGGAFHLKGTGWYKTDYASPSSSGSSSGGSSKADTGSDASAKSDSAEKSSTSEKKTEDKKSSSSSSSD